MSWKAGALEDQGYVASVLVVKEVGQILLVRGSWRASKISLDGQVFEGSRSFVLFDQGAQLDWTPIGNKFSHDFAMIERLGCSSPPYQLPTEGCKASHFLFLFSERNSRRLSRGSSGRRKCSQLTLQFPQQVGHHVQKPWIHWI